MDRKAFGGDGFPVEGGMLQPLSSPGATQYCGLPTEAEETGSYCHRLQAEKGPWEMHAWH